MRQALAKKAATEKTQPVKLPKPFQANPTQTRGPVHEFSSVAAFGHDFSQIPVHPNSPFTIQPKLTVNTPGDEYEQEADRISDHVMRSSDGGRKNRQNTCGHFQTMRLKANDAGKPDVPPIVHEVLSSSGQPLDAATRAFMEPRFGLDFSHVRVHAVGKAMESARAIGAVAYTLGHNLVFGAGQFEPYTFNGKRLLAHELTHVLQNSQSTVRRQAGEGESILPNLFNLGLGTVNNQTDKTFIAEASEKKDSLKIFTVIKRGKWGGAHPAEGQAGEKLHDIDFVWATPTTPLNGQTKGKFKIGSNDATIYPDPKAKDNSKIDNFTRYET